MAFVLDQSGTYSWPVTVEFPVDGGRFQKQTFDAEFKRLEQPRIKEVMLQINGDEIGDRELCEEVLVGWSGIKDSKGDDVPFSMATRQMLLDIALVAGAVVRAWFDSLGKGKFKI